jgi:flagellar hook protein FlgE
MIGALFSGLSGIRSHQTEMDVIGSNIANINTIGYKTSRTSFEEALVITLRGGVKPESSRGGLNPVQIGMGSTVGGIDTIFKQGALQQTGRTTDLAIIGDGFFILSDGEQHYYSRAGDFQFDASGRLVTRNGYSVQGWNADTEGKIAKDAPIGDITLPYGRRIPAKATTKVSFTGNLDSRWTSSDDPYVISTTIYDSQGEGHTLSITLTKTTSSNTWDWEATLSGGEEVTGGGSGTITFNPDGSVKEVTFTDPNATALVIDPKNGAEQMTIELDFGEANSFEGLTQHASQFTAVVSSQDGYTAGNLETVSIQEDGRILGTFSNGVTQTLAQIAIARFSNPSGLVRLEKNLYGATGNSGDPFIGTAGSSIQASIVSGALEQSNVDLASEFTKLIIAQRGFQANSRVITTSNDVLEDLVNLKR